MVVLGDSGCGKTSLLLAFKKGVFPESLSIPTILSEYTHQFNVNRQQLKLKVSDTAGQEEYNSLRCLTYLKSHIFAICFSIGSPNSLYHIEETWIRELNNFAHPTSIILIGCKKDMRDENDSKCVTTEEGQLVASKINACRYIECSALTGENISNLFNYAAFESIKKTRRSRLFS
ncbi:Rho1 GTP-binding protein [Pilobolus umbonatus]|nr:Rho1 GTP-binding protein [Pilobolus umbonatus]